MAEKNVDTKTVKKKEMTNLEYAKTLTRDELSRIVKVANEFIEKLVGKDAPLDKREKAYIKWCVEKFDPDVWYKDWIRNTTRKEEEYFYGV